MPVAAIGNTGSGLVLRKIPGIHDSIAPLIPGTTNVGLAVCRIVATATRTARILEASADLASGAHGRVRLTAMGDVESRFVATNRIAFRAAAVALRDVFDAVVPDDREIGVCPFGQEALRFGEGCCRSTCDQ